MGIKGARKGNFGALGGRKTLTLLLANGIKLEVKPLWKVHMKNWILAILTAITLGSAFAAETNAPAAKPRYYDPNLVWDSIGANHLPVRAFKELDCWFVICKTRNTNLVDVPAVYYDPRVAIFSTTPAGGKSYFGVNAGVAGEDRKFFYLRDRNLGPKFKWIKLHSSVLNSTALTIPHSSPSALP